MSFWHKDPLYQKCGIFALLLHGIILCVCVCSSQYPQKKTPSKMVVHTVTSSAKTSTVSSSVAQKNPPVSYTPQPKTPAADKPKSVAKRPEKKTQKTAKKPPVEKQTLAKTKPKENSSEQLQKSLEKIEETIAKIASKGDTMPSSNSSSLTLKKEVDSEPFFAMSAEERYVSSLVQCLQNQLELPDIGEVKIELRLRKDGSVSSMKVLYAESPKNRKRIEERLPHLRFPVFPGQEEKLFILMFCNEL